jgi:hypothetical protein
MAFPSVPESTLPDSVNRLTLDCVDMPLSELQQILTETFKIRIFFSKSLASEKLTTSYVESSLKDVLDSLCWSFSTDYLEKDGIYYVGGGRDMFLVRYNYGIKSTDIEGAFKSQVKFIEDKIVIQGSEKDVKKIDDSMNSLIKRDYSRFHIRGIDISKRFFMELGIDIEQSIKYSLSWNSLMKTQFNPIVAGAIAIYASLKENETNGAYKNIIDTDIYCVSGIESTLNIGLQVDRQLYTSSVEQGTKVTSGFNTQQTGIIMKLTAFKNDNSWFVKTYLEDSTFINDFSKSVVSAMNNIILNDNREIVFMHYTKKKSQEDQSKGVPFISRIPLLGYFFAVKDESTEDRDIYFSIQKID